ncbi:GSCFA domain-containing protein [Salinimicrobium flavum]|uniref:GSCFA domain-containing protein n=1 Tax=Salinimicrobium flavum TaxID=1737065 RepID=A0ABW5IWL9_9FLAO
MEFRTQVPIHPQEPKIGYSSKVLLLGSCFVENMGNKLEYFKFQQLLNPFGILFHPAAIHNFLNSVVQKKKYTEEDIFFHNDAWHSYRAHSDLSSLEKEVILDRLNSAAEETRTYLKTASHVIITPGTAWGYRLKKTGETVANCHKVPQKNFSKELIDVETNLFECVRLVRELNPEVTVIFTVSPVRHLKDGFIENQLSKSRLITAVHQVISEEKNTAYFPAYEIMMDELRDYRFYAEDMLHPNAIAIDYIWEKFTETWIPSEALPVMKKVETIQKGLSHRPFNEDSEAHKKFRKDLQKKISDLQNNYPEIRF